MIFSSVIANISRSIQDQPSTQRATANAAQPRGFDRNDQHGQQAKVEATHILLSNHFAVAYTDI